VTTQTDPNVDPAERHEHFWPAGAVEAGRAIDELRAQLLPRLEQRREQRRGSDTDLAEQLERTQAHELDLLEQVSHTYSDGYTAAAGQLSGLLAHAFSVAPSRELAGLARALRVAESLRPGAHRVTLTDERGLIVPVLDCTAPVGAPCRVTCEGAVAGRCDERCECAEPSLVDGGVCLAAGWLNDYDPPDFLAARVGRPDRELTSAPVAVRWSGSDAAWQWTYTDELPEGVDDEQWARPHAER
jgi:hypothetical protein